MLQTFELESKIGPDMVDGQLLKTRKHETVPGVYTYEFKVPSGMIFCSVSGGVLREISYHYKSIFPWVRNQFCKKLLESYGTDGEWQQISNSKFGKMYRSRGGLYYAAVGTGSKYMDIGSMMFHEDKFKIVS